MADAFVSFSNQNSVDLFPSFKTFHEPKDDQGAFTIDQRDVEELKNNTSTILVQKSKKSKRHNVSSNSIDKTNPVAQCDICLVPISGPIVYDSHMKGKKHQTQLTTVLAKNPQYKAPTYEELCSKKQEPTDVNNQSEKLQASQPELSVNDQSTAPPLIPSKKLNCNLCNVSCNSQQMFDNHVAGRKHQMKVKANSLTNPAPPRIVPDNNPSSSNYCDVCSKQLNSEDELTEHLSQKRHQTRVKEAESCAKDAADMNISFDDYKISITDAEKDKFDYQCTTCVKKFKFKKQLIDHLKSALHIQLSNRSNNNQRLTKKSNRGNHQATRGGIMRGGTTTRGQSYPSFRGSNNSSGKSRPYRSQGSFRNQPSQSYDKQFNEQTSSNIFGAFDPSNQLTYSSNDNYYPATKRPTQYEQIPNEYDGFYPKRARTYNNDDNTVQDFYPKRARTYNNEGNTSQDFYPTDTNYYPSSTSSTVSNYPSNSNNYSSQTSDYTNQSSVSQSPWQYQSEPHHYEQHQYSNPESSYTNPMHYPSNQPPLPDYEPPPLPNYPPPSSHTNYPQNPAYLGDTGNQGNKNYFQNSFHH